MFSPRADRRSRRSGLMSEGLPPCQVLPASNRKIQPHPEPGCETPHRSSQPMARWTRQANCEHVGSFCRLCTLNVAQILPSFPIFRIFQRTSGMGFSVGINFRCYVVYQEAVGRSFWDSAEGWGTAVVASRSGWPNRFSYAGHVTMKKARRTQFQHAKLTRLRRHLDISIDPDKPRRLRTRSARYAAALAEQLGMIERPRCCSWCRRRRRLERHHWDYNEPLLVTFLCSDCHEIADSMARGAEIA